jgi:hypothetical protein
VLCCVVLCCVVSSKKIATQSLPSTLGVVVEPKRSPKRIHRSIATQDGVVPAQSLRSPVSVPPASEVEIALILVPVLEVLAIEVQPPSLQLQRPLLRQQLQLPQPRIQITTTAAVKVRLPVFCWILS